jgi:hypothetical protein
MNNYINQKNIRLWALILFIIFGIFDFIQFCVSPIGVDAGYFLSIARDWVTLGRLPGVDTFSAYTTIGYLFYAIPFVLFKVPSIEIFLFLNLLLFALSYIIYFKVVNSLISNKIIVLIVLFSFVYNFNGITADVKLENITLFLNICMLYILSQFYLNNTIKLNEQKVLLQSIFLGMLAGLSFLTKQYGGLSLLFIPLILVLLNIQNRGKIIFTSFLSFGILVLIYLTLQTFLGLRMNEAFHQMVGKMEIDCFGSDYGEKKWLNLFISLKYYRFDLIYIIGVFLGIFLIQTKNTNNNRKLLSYILIILSFTLAQLPFYFQVYPHYKVFGLPFILFLTIIWLREGFLNLLSSYFWLNKVFIIGFILLSCYSFYSWGKTYKIKAENKQERLSFEEKVRGVIPRGSEVFMFGSRKIWFTNHFVTPVPKIISYGFVGFDCLSKALTIEKPISFWVAGANDLNGNVMFEDYLVTDSVEVVHGSYRLSAIKYSRF